MAKAKKFVAELPPTSGHDTFIGIDLSLSCTAVVALRDNGTVRFDQTTVTSNGDSLFKRIEIVRDAISRQVSKFKPLLVIETPHGGMPGGAVLQLSALAFAVRASVGVYPMLNITPAQVKAFVKSGALKKNQMLKEVYRKWGYDADNDNLADAYALARIGLAYCNGCQHEYERVVLEKICEHHRKSIWSF